MKPFVEAQFYDRGTAGIPEDGLWPHLPLVGVWDGVSAPFNSEHLPVLFNGLTGGQLAGKILLEGFSSVRDVDALISYANKRMGQLQEREGLSLGDASQLGGATFCFAEIKKNHVNILQGGDCYAVWINTNGSVGMTHNYFLPFEIELRQKIAELMQETEGNRQEMWKRFYPFLCEKRRENTNVRGRCALLNGQPALVDHIQRVLIPIGGIDTLILLTDGFIPFSEAENEKTLAKEIASLYKKGRLVEVLSWNRRLEGERADTSHETFSEATGLSIKF